MKIWGQIWIKHQQKSKFLENKIVKICFFRCTYFIEFLIKKLWSIKNLIKQITALFDYHYSFISLKESLVAELWQWKGKNAFISILNIKSTVHSFIQFVFEIYFSRKQKKVTMAHCWLLESRLPIINRETDLISTIAKESIKETIDVLKLKFYLKQRIYS